MAKICSVNLLLVGANDANINHSDKSLISVEREYTSAPKRLGHARDENVTLSQIRAPQLCCFLRGKEAR